MDEGQKKIAFICEDLSVEMGGQAVTIPNLGRALSKEGAMVTYFAGKRFGSFRNENSEKKNSDGNFVYFTYFGLRFKFSFSLFFLILFRRKKIDIIHCNNIWNFVPVIAYLASKLIRKPYVFSLRGMAMYEDIYSSNLKRVLFYCFFKKILKGSKFLHITSEEERKSLRLLDIETKAILIPHGLERKIPNLKFSEVNDLRSEKKKIIFVGRVCEHKNLEILIEAFSLFLKDFPQWNLTIVGPIEDKPYYSSLITIINKHSLNEKINFIGNQIGSDLDKEYLEASIFASTSKSENFGMAIAEALGFGLPCLAPKNSPWKIIEENNVGYQIRGNTKEVSLALSLTAGNLINNKKVFLSAINCVKSLSWEKQAIIMLDSYNA